MAAAYSMDLRERVLADYDKGVGGTEVAKRYHVSRNWVYKLLRIRRETGRIEPLQGRRGPKPKLATYTQQLRELVTQQPDATLTELQQQLPVKVCLSTICLALRNLGVTLKKSPSRRRATTA